MSASRAARFGQIIRARRHELDLTQQEIAKRIKVSQSLVHLLESGKRSPPQEIIQPLAEVLGFDARPLFFLARPHARAIFSPSLMARKPGVLNFLYYKRTKFPANPVPSARRRLKHDHLLRRFHDISDADALFFHELAEAAEKPGSAQHDGRDRLLNFKEAAVKLGTTLDWLYHHHKRLPFTVRLCSSRPRFSENAIEEYIRKHRMT